MVAIASPNLIYSVLALLVTFIHIAGIYVLLNAEFIAVLQIIVYAGAILVLYLFVLMFFNPKEEKQYLQTQLPVGIFLVVVILGLMVLAATKSQIFAGRGVFTVQSARLSGNTQWIGQALYTDFIFPFEIASFILLVAMLGAIILAGRRGRRPRNIVVSPLFQETGGPSGFENSVSSEGPRAEPHLVVQVRETPE